MLRFTHQNPKTSRDSGVATFALERDKEGWCSACATKDKRLVAS